jgi:serine/threonine protein kinase
MPRNLYTHWIPWQQGAQAQIYRVWQYSLEQWVCIRKSTLQVEATPWAKLRSLNHPALPRVYDYWQEGTAQFLVMDFIEGVSLDSIAWNELPESMWCKVFLDTMNALFYLAEQGLIHGDIKPQNVMLTLHGKACLVDFGFSSVNGKGADLGTPLYASPQVLQGEPLTITSDYFACAALFAQLQLQVASQAVGVPSWDGILAQSYWQDRVQKEIQDPLWRDFLAKCLAVEPSERPDKEEVQEYLDWLYKNALHRESISHHTTIIHKRWRKTLYEKELDYGMILRNLKQWDDLYQWSKQLYNRWEDERSNALLREAVVQLAAPKPRKFYGYGLFFLVVLVVMLWFWQRQDPLPQLQQKILHQNPVSAPKTQPRLYASKPSKVWVCVSEVSLQAVILVNEEPVPWLENCRYFTQGTYTLKVLQRDSAVRSGILYVESEQFKLEW